MIHIYYYEMTLNKLMSFFYIYCIHHFLKLYHRFLFTSSDCYSSYESRVEQQFSLKLYCNIFGLNVFRVIALKSSYILGFMTFSRLPISHPKRTYLQRIPFSFSSSKKLSITFLFSYGVVIIF